MAQHYELILVGTGFASSFFLHAFLERSGPSTRVLVLERGARDSHPWQIEHRRNSSTDPDEMVRNHNPDKPWTFTPAFGGGSNCWWGVTPRMLPSDFRCASLYGVSRDWPLEYHDLEPFYCEAERLMSISGPSDDSPFERSEPYPQPPHILNSADRRLKRAFPDSFFVQPTARARTAVAGRSRCCATGVCELCPIDAKFTIENGMARLYEDPRVELRLLSGVQTIETRGDVVSGVRYRSRGRERQASSDLVALGANALFNPVILLRSGIDHPEMGRGLVEQTSVDVVLDLTGVDGFDGSTSITGHGYMFYDGDHRASRGAAILETFSAPPQLRADWGRWRERLRIKFLVEDLPQPENRVRPWAEDPEVAEVFFAGHSDYAQKTLAEVPRLVETLASALPIEDFTVRDPNPTDAHIQGTTIMGDDPETSVVDGHSFHHRLRNLAVLGSGTFPSCPPANPTLTIAALALRAARRLFS